MNQPEPTSSPAPVDLFERGMTRALQRVDAPAGFVEGVMAVVEAEQHGKRSQSRQQVLPGNGNRVWALSRPATWASGALAALLLLGAWAGEQVHARHQRQQAQLAQQQFEIALRVTDQALDQTRQQLARAGLRFQ